MLKVGKYMKIQLIVPCYNEEQALPYFFEAISSVEKTLQTNGHTLEIIYVDDGSKDKTLELLHEEADKNSRKFISFSRNFGKEAAIYAGLQHASGDYISLMDADLQDPPEMLLEMAEILKNSDYDCVATRRVNRDGEPPVRSWFAHKFYQIINKISDADIMDGARDFRMMKRSMVDAILKITEHNRFSKGIFGWVGFKIKWLDFKNRERVAGVTKWSFWKLFKYALDGIVDFSDALLKIPYILGAIYLLVYLFERFIVRYIRVDSLIVLGVLAILLSLGIFGMYIKNIYADTRNRPIYIIRETNIDKI